MKDLMVRDERGMTTAEYAVGILVAVTFAGVMFKVVSDPKTLEMVTRVVETALNRVYYCSGCGSRSSTSRNQRPHHCTKPSSSGSSQR